MGYQKLRPQQYVDPDFIFQITQGRTPRYKAFTKFASNPSVMTDEVDIWQSGGTQQYLTSAEQMSIVSDSANDADGGTGAHSVHLIGLDNDFNLLEEDVLLNGLTPVLTVALFLRIFRMTVTAAGSLETNAGDITIEADVAGFIQGTAVSGDGKTLKSQFTTPKGFFGMVLEWVMSDLSGDQIRFRMRVREAGGVFVIRRQLDINESTFHDDFGVPILIEPLSDIKITGQKDIGANPAVADASYSMLLIDEREIQRPIDEDTS